MGTLQDIPEVLTIEYFREAVPKTGFRRPHIGVRTFRLLVKERQLLGLDVIPVDSTVSEMPFGIIKVSFIKMVEERMDFVRANLRNFGDDSQGFVKKLAEQLKEN